MVTLETLTTKYESYPWTYSPNKNKMPKNHIFMENVSEFNDIFQFCKKNYHYVEATASGSIPYNNQVRNVQRFIVNCTSVGFELVLCTLEGCFRFILSNKVAEDNCVSGTKALKEIYNTARAFGVLDIFQKESKSKEEGLKIKEEIESPIINVTDESYLGKEFDNVHHIDFNSSYASRISEKYPKLKSMYDYLYERRKQNNGYYKHVLTNSIGMMQSKYCVDSESSLKTCPYQLSTFAKTAINGNNDLIKEYILKLKLSGRKPLLINTDGIWYQGDIYHDNNEGTKLCQWKNDHTNCKLYIKSPGAYQYIEEEKIQSVVRGFTNLDMMKPRDKWTWREIDNVVITKYEFNKEKGVILK